MGNRLINRAARCFALAISGAAVALAVLSPAAVAETSRGWLLVTPPPIPEKRTLMKVYVAGSDAEVQAAVASLPGDEQVRLVTKVYKILTIPTVAARRSEEHTSELQSHVNLVCRLLLEKKKQ